MPARSPAAIAILLGVTQTLAWASTYYLPAMVATPMAAELGVGTATIFAAFSVALLLSAATGPMAGQAIDRFGGRRVLIGSNLVFATGLALLSQAQGPLGAFAGWGLLGIGMGAGLYEGAFATVVRLQGHGARGVITGITLLGGFASTIGWPITAWLTAHEGWRAACLAWAAAHLLLGVPLHALLPGVARRASVHDGRSSGEPEAIKPPLATTLVLSFVFATTWFISTAVAAHFPRLLMAGGATLAGAVFAGTLIGPAQVGARLLEFGLLRRMHPLLSTRIATLAHPVGALVFALLGAPSAAAFALLHGAGNGILTIAKGTLPLALFGPAGYGRRQGLLMAPARVAQALAPWLFGLALDRWGTGALGVTAALGLLAFLAVAGLSSRGHRPST